MKIVSDGYFGSGRHLIKNLMEYSDSATSKTPGRFGNKFIAARYAAEGAELVMGERESPGPEASTSRLIPQKRIDGNV